MKKLFTFILCAVTAIAVRAQFSGSGNGTAADPYRIYTDIHLAQMANFLNQEGVVFELMKDIDLSSYIAENSPSQGWSPIGVESTPFMGVLKGNNHTISGMYINRPNLSNVGLFGYIKNATITDIHIKGSSITGGSLGVGTLVGTAQNSTISDGSIKMTGIVKANQNVGIIAGKAENCHISSIHTETASVSGTNHVGGCIGFMLTEGSILNCSAITNISGTNHVGGIVGRSSQSTISNCNIVGDVTGTSDHTGGIVGYIVATNISNSKSKGNVTGITSAGGIAGFAEGTCEMTNLSSTCNVVGSTNVGGIVGCLKQSSIVTFASCHSKGIITNTGDYTGGIVGKSDGVCINSMDDCSHFGDIKGKNYVGGLLGAMLSTEAVQTLSTYEIRYGGENANIVATFQDEIVLGTTKARVINNCTSIGNIEGAIYVGGLAGDILCATSYSQSTKNVTFTKTGGALYVCKDGVYTGKNATREITFPINVYAKDITTISLLNSYYSGNITGTDDVGGLVGHKVGGDINNCYTNATINGTTNVGGLVGNLEGYSSTQPAIIKSSVANNASITASSSNVGRIYGSKGDNVTIGVMASAQGNRALTQTSVMLCGVAQVVIDDEQNGTSVGPSMLKLKANYVSWGWDFDKNWNILETECFPYKKYQAAPPVIDSKLESQDTEVIGHSVNGGTVYMYYKNREAVSTVCDGNNWAFTTDALQSGAQVQLYADVDGMTPSYFTSAIVKYPGSGTEEDPYRIYTAEDLQGASNSGYYKLMNDIDLTAWINENSPEKGWPAIGRNSTVATYINGDGHKVSGLWINTTEGYNGLFSNYSAGYIKNLTVEVAAGKSVKGGDYTGVLIGRMANGQIINCTVKGTVEGTIHAGGVVGYAENTEISSTSFDGTVKSSTASAYVGGIAGYDKEVTTTGSNAHVTINATGNSSHVGGLYGKSESGTIANSYAYATINATGSSDYVGGLVGYSESAVSLSYSAGEVQATGANSYTGGLIGYAKSSVANSYSTATVEGTFYVAGLVGYTFSTIDKCYAKGDVTGARYGAGLVGQLDGTAAAVTSSVAANNILTLTDQAAWGCRVIGGFKNGCTEPTLGSNLALSTMQVSLNGVAQKKTDDNIEGVAKTEAELMSASTYLALNWDMSDAWSIDEGSIYPYLLWEVDINPVADLSLDKTTAVLAVGNSLTLSANIQPLSATNKRLTWTSSKPSVASVEDGIVTAVAVGEATITATTTDGSNLSASCKVTVVANLDEAIAELQTLVDQAQALYDNSTEGENIGQYAPGSRAALLAVIKAAKAKISSTMSESDITECTTQITNAINAFKAQQVSAGADTDLSQFDNVVYVKSLEARAGGQAVLSLQLDNVDPVIGFELKLYLPEGVSVATNTDSYGETMIGVTMTNDRTTPTRHTFETSLKDDVLTVLCYSVKKYSFLGNSGEVAQITVNIADDMAEGEYPIIVKQEAISLNGSTPLVDYVKTTLTISDFRLGDANGDGFINVGDITTVAGYILGEEPQDIVLKAADANEDTYINVGDITTIAGMILDGTASNAPVRDNDEAEAAFDPVGVELCPGSEVIVPIAVRNTEAAFTSFQFDVQLPEGISIVKAELNEGRVSRSDFFACEAIANDAVRVLNFNLSGKEVAGTEGAIVYLTLCADAAVADGIYSAAITDGVFARGKKTLSAAETSISIAVNSVNGIESLIGSSEQVDVFDMRGIRVYTGAMTSESLVSLPSGVYTINGKKFIK